MGDRDDEGSADEPTTDEPRDRDDEPAERDDDAPASEEPSDDELSLSPRDDPDEEPRDDVEYGPERPPDDDAESRDDVEYGPERPPAQTADEAPDLPEDLEGGFDEGEGVGSEGRDRGAPEDEEMPLTDHVEEMLRRGAVVMFVIVLAAVVTFPFGEEIINFLWANALPQTGTRPHLYQPLELVVTQIKVASLAGVVVSLPVLVYESYLFMRPGLYPHERRYYLAAVPTSLVLAFVGLVFGYFVLLPAIFTYFYSYSKDVTEIAFALGRTFDLILVLLGYLAVVFQLPLFIMLAMMMGIVTREWLAQRRLLFWFSFLGLSFFVSPDPTGMAPIILTITMVVLFEGTLFLSKWAGRSRNAIPR